MRILLTSDPEIPVPPEHYGGIQRIIFELANFLIEKNCEVGLLAHPDSKVEDATLYPWPGQQSQNPYDTIRNMVTLMSAVKDFEPDVLHSFSRLQYMLPIALGRLPKIMSYQREPSTRTTKLASKIIKNISFTGCSEYICDLGRRAPGNWKCIYNFVNTDIFKAKIDTGEDSPLVFLSRVDRIKGAHIAISVAKELQVPLVIAGNKSPLPAEEEYFNSEIFPHIDNKLIKYVGPVNDSQKISLLQNAKAMFVPIEWDEPFGIVFVESLACGTPVITCPRGAAPEIIRSGTEGYLCESREEMLEAVNQISKIDRQNCRKRVEQLFSQSVVCNQYYQYYQQRLNDI